MDIQFGLGIKYDDDGDGSISAGEVNEYKQDRLYR
jgi:hypothetical protein